MWLLQTTSRAWAVSQLPFRFFLMTSQFIASTRSKGVSFVFAYRFFCCWSIISLSFRESQPEQMDSFMRLESRSCYSYMLRSLRVSTQKQTWRGVSRDFMLKWRGIQLRYSNMGVFAYFLMSSSFWFMYQLSSVRLRQERISWLILKVIWQFQGQTRLENRANRMMELNLIMLNILLGKCKSRQNEEDALS